MGTLCIWLIGSILLLAGLLKALNPRPFIAHVNRFNLFSPQFSGLLAFLFIQIENALAVSLLLRLYLSSTLLVSIVLLLGLSVLTLWGSLTGRIENCGCYGRMIWLKPKHSLLLNLFYILGLGYVWRLSLSASILTWMDIFLLILTVGGTGFLIKRSLVRPIFYLSPLRVGGRWKKKWIPDFRYAEDQTVLFLFTRQGCAECSRWHLILSEIEKSEFMGEIQLIASDNDQKKFNQKEEDPSYPVLYIPAFYFSYLVEKTPTALLVKNQVIKGVWETQFPFELFLTNKNPGMFT